MATKTPYQVQKSGDNRIYEVKAETFEELVVEGRKRLGLGEEEIEEIILEGDKKVDRDNFQSLNPNTVLIFKFRYGEHTVNNLFKSLEECHSSQPDILTDYLKNNPKRAKLIQDLNEGIGGNMAEDRKDDDKWFKDVDGKYKTKSQFMRYKAKTRTKSYLSDTREKLVQKNDDEEMKQKKRDVIKKFSSKLTENSYYDKRFDRYDEGNEKLCNRDGKFDCKGAYNEDSCDSNNHINPYLNRGYCKLFSFWNLDHRIEKGREVLPQLEKAIKDSSRKVNLDYFYELLFTMKNLKLVCTECHDKKDHQLRVDMTQVFLS
ncbi:DNA fragmentation factor subunit beta-like [Apostichopus japonicus]|uniref:DNA fragmentation factor subunit beta-like n=1 Tax=Stichopus japonicus TaxID=307972 RepID=UPI003AB7DB3A